MLFVSHNLAAIADLAVRGIVLDFGIRFGQRSSRRRDFDLPLSGIAASGLRCSPEIKVIAPPC